MKACASGCSPAGVVTSQLLRVFSGLLRTHMQLRGAVSDDSSETVAWAGHAPGERAREDRDREQLGQETSQGAEDPNSRGGVPAEACAESGYDNRVKIPGVDETLALPEYMGGAA